MWSCAPHPNVKHFSFLISFGRVCHAYRSGSTLCDGKIGENVNVYTRRQDYQLERALDAVSVVLVTTPNRCKDLIRNVLCLYYYPPCGFNETFTPLVSICPEECFHIQHECADVWKQVESLLNVFESDLEVINCSNPGQILDPLPHCCVDAGITMDTSTSIPGHTHMQKSCFKTITVWGLKLTIYLLYTFIFKKLQLRFFVLQCLQVPSVHQWLQQSPLLQ